MARNSERFPARTRQPAPGDDEKRLIRIGMVNRIRDLSRESRREMERRMIERIVQLPAWSSARLVLGYLAMDDEAAVDSLVHTALAERKQVALPRIDPDGEEMRFLLVPEGLDALETHRFGFRQPPATAKPAEVETRGYPTIVLVPGRAFDRTGHRIGHGGGYYDRFLSTIGQHVFSIGVGYNVQCCERLPCDPWDMSVHVVVTDLETIHCLEDK